MINYDELIELLLSPSPKMEAAYLAVRALGLARTSDVATALKMDRSNAGKLLEKLEDDGRVVVVDDCDVLPSQRGRPSRLWAVV